MGPTRDTAVGPTGQWRRVLGWVGCDECIAVCVCIFVGRLFVRSALFFSFFFCFEFSRCTDVHREIRLTSLEECFQEFNGGLLGTSPL